MTDNITPNPDPSARAPKRLLSRAQLATLAAQVVSVVFAVLVALAVDEWWEERENAELGRRGVEAITAEVRGNLAQLENDTARIARVLANVDSALALLRSGLDDIDLNIDYSVALLSSAAWHTAQTTRAVHFVDISQVIRIARVYDLQLFFLRNQERLTDMIADIASVVDDDPQKAIADVRRRYLIVTGFRAALTGSYRCLLAELEETPPPAGVDCAS